eukprot:m.240325 g.240325  ORF g.240325 m.240325 type:complete len:459 (+) comp14874_c0_seq1:43-1419(+)
MSVLETILKDMFVAPEILDQLSKDQKEFLFYKMREEQVRRWQEQAHTIPKTRPTAKLQWAASAKIWEDHDVEKRASEAAERLKKLELQREEEEMKQDEEEAKILAEIELKKQIELKTAEAERKAEELRMKEEQEKKELEERAARERQMLIEREEYMTMKEAKKAAEKEAKELKKREAETKKIEAKRIKEEAKVEKQRQKAEKEIMKQAQQKQQEIYLSMREIRDQARKAKEEEEKQMDQLFLQQQETARKADEEKRAAVNAARERAKKMDEQALGDALRARAPSLNKRPPPLPGRQGTSSTRRSPMPLPSDAGKPEARASRPANESEVRQWFKQEEFTRRIGRDAVGRWRPWFHGIVSRGEAENMLRGKPVGSFLIRVSTRIWGYTLSFVDCDRFKHFLIDASEKKYKVFGSQSSRDHADLQTLVSFHQSKAVSKTGTKLTQPIGVLNNNPSVPLLLQ